MRGCKSSFYAISACGAATIFLIQTALNVFGSLDLLPLTGVTLPFISNGGSSIITCWCLLAFIKSASDNGQKRT
jgi:cell division protein FtsW (lipid II flippase)